MMDKMLQLHNLILLLTYTAFLSLSWEYVTEFRSGELIFAGTFSAKDEFYGRFDPAVYNYELGANMAVDKTEKLDLSLTYTQDNPNGGDDLFSVRPMLEFNDFYNRSEPTPA